MTSARIHEVPPPLSIYDCATCKRRVADIKHGRDQVTIDLEPREVYRIDECKLLVQDIHGNRWEERREDWIRDHGCFLRHECKA